MPGPLDQQTAQNLMQGTDFQDPSNPIRQLLEENTPSLIPGPLGRVRLVEGLSQRFGANFRAMEGPRAALNHFDEQTKAVAEALQAKGYSNG